ncbi:MAG: DUF4476 domain-containing protein [Deltaproteobacteria bacterium]|nr:DUF4476 domain-containing protein [Deltaproteobacteria bacterium]
MHRFVLVFCAAALFMGSAHAAEAASVYGSWRSSSGNVFTITQTGAGFRLSATLTKGGRKVLHGNWVPGMRGLQFSYWDGVKVIGTFRPGDPNRIRVRTPTTTTWWQRMNSRRRAGQRATIFGPWRSTTGNLFDVSYKRARRFQLMLTATNGRREQMGGRWVPGMRGTQFEYHSRGRRFTGTFRAGDPNRIRIVSSTGESSWWTRGRGARRGFSTARRTLKPVRPAPAVRYAMRRAAFASLKSEVRRQSMDRNKVGVVEVAARRNYVTCEQARQLLQLLSFGRTKIKALRALAPRIVDRSNAHVILGVFSFSRDKRTASQLLK